MSTNVIRPKIVSRDEWLATRKQLLAEEKEFTRQYDALAAKQRALPWVRIEKEYVFDSPSGKVTLAQVFHGRSQLFIKHFMMGPGAGHQCVGCSLEVDHVEGILEHLANHDVSYVAVARAPIEEIELVRKRMGWHFPWVSSYRSDFNYDFGVSFKPDEVASGRAFYNFQPAPEWAAGIQDLSGDSIFYKDENGPYHSLTDWARPKNMYDKGGMVEPNGRYHAPNCDCAGPLLAPGSGTGARERLGQESLPAWPPSTCSLGPRNCRPIRAFLKRHKVETATPRGWDTLKNGELLACAEEVGSRSW